jgi:hypothetical protein
MTTQNYTFMQSTTWQFDVISNIDLTSFTPYCTAKLNNSVLVGVATVITPNTVRVVFASTSLAKKGIYKYDVEINNSVDNYTIQKGDIIVI